MSMNEYIFSDLEINQLEHEYHRCPCGAEDSFSYIVACHPYNHCYLVDLAYCIKCNCYRILDMRVTNEPTVEQ